MTSVPPSMNALPPNVLAPARMTRPVPDLTSAVFPPVNGPMTEFTVMSLSELLISKRSRVPLVVPAPAANVPELTALPMVSGPAFDAIRIAPCGEASCSADPAPRFSTCDAESLINSEFSCVVPADSAMFVLDELEILGVVVIPLARLEVMSV